MLLANINIRDFYGSILKDVKLNKYDLLLFFEPGGKIEIQEYWEYLDDAGKEIDRSLSFKYRKEFRLSSLIGTKFIESNIVPGNINLIFDNQHVLRVYLNRELKQSSLLSKFITMYDGPLTGN